jgi:hypothetical protein
VIVIAGVKPFNQAPIEPHLIPKITNLKCRSSRVYCDKYPLCRSALWTLRAPFLPSSDSATQQKTGSALHRGTGCRSRYCLAQMRFYNLYHLGEVNLEPLECLERGHALRGPTATLIDRIYKLFILILAICP